MWVVTGGSPCQDLSIAGKRAGLAGARSGLFMEQVRIVKEMRAEDKRNGRTGNMVRPRFLVWENVVGAFSSNRGRDFAAVLEEIARIAEPGFSLSGLPEKWKWTKAGAIDGDGWSIAWRTHDAKDWGKTIRDSRTGNVIRLGTPQRRRRISVVADFGGESAAQIQFDRESVSGHPAESGAAGERPAEDAEAGFNPAVADVTTCCLQGNGIDRADTAGCNGKGWKADESYTLNTIDRPAVCAEVSCLNPWDAQSARVYDQEGAWHSLNANENGGMARDSVLCAGFKLGNSEKAHSIGYEEETSPTLNAECGGNKPAVVAFATNQREEVRDIGEKSVALAAEPGMHCQTFVAQKLPAVALDMTHACDVIRECGEQVPALQARMGTGGNQVPLTYQMNGFGDYRAAEVASSCKQRDFKDSTDLAITHMVVRRLTPMECERLQGFPECMEMDVEEMTKDEYIAVNIATGQIVVDCESGEIYTTKGPGGVRLKEPKKLDGSNVNGYKVVSIRNGQTKMQCRVHRIVWIARNGVIPNGCVVDHINNDKTDNRICNLQLLTAEENSHKAWQDGRYLMGDDSPSTKLPVSRRKEIVELYKSGEYTMRQLANDFGISKSRVHQIVKTSGWTDIGEWTDEKGKKHKDADSPRYKALGNSIALPFWDWMLRRMARYLPEDATLGSLFDGIAGFPLIWERIHGKGTARWASEIEPFPIAVTKRWFGEE